MVFRKSWRQTCSPMRTVYATTDYILGPAPSRITAKPSPRPRSGTTIDSRFPPAHHSRFFLPDFDGDGLLTWSKLATHTPSIQAVSRTPSGRPECLGYDWYYAHNTGYGTFQPTLVDPGNVAFAKTLTLSNRRGPGSNMEVAGSFRRPRLPALSAHHCLEYYQDKFPPADWAATAVEPVYAATSDWVADMGDGDGRMRDHSEAMTSALGGAALPFIMPGGALPQRQSRPLKKALSRLSIGVGTLRACRDRPGRCASSAEMNTNLVREAATAANREIIENFGLQGSGYHIHELQPVKFGGSPTDLANKVFMLWEDHVGPGACIQSSGIRC